jgi:hypothetical protein
MSHYASSLSHFFLFRIEISIFLACLICPAAFCQGSAQRPWPVQDRSLLIDPVFVPTKLSDTFHMNPIIQYNNEFLRPGEFDLDLAMGTFGTDFKKAEKYVYLEENSDNAFYTDLGWRYGLCDSIGSLEIPVEIYTQLPIFWSAGSLASWKRPALTAPFAPIGHVDEETALGKWIWGLRFGLIKESTFLPSLTLQGSLGLPVDDSLASDGVDGDVRLNFEKHLGRGFVGTFYGGSMFPGKGKEVFTDLGIEKNSYVPYVGLLLESNFAQLVGCPEPGSLWFYFGGSWRDALYDFGAVGPDYTEEELKVTGGVSFDLGYWGRFLGCPQGMIGLVHTAHGGPEAGENELTARINFPYRYKWR